MDKPIIFPGKLMNPRLPEPLIHRSDLYSILDEGVSNRLIVVTAPAGYGKTTLVNAWIRNNPVNSIWITLDDLDNDPAKFVNCLLTASDDQVDHTEGLSFPQVTSQVDDPPQSKITQSLLQTACRLPFTMVVLDNYQVIKNPVIHQIIEAMVQNQPEFSHGSTNQGFRFILISRSQLPFSITLWKLRGEITEITTENLRYTFQNVDQLANHQFSLKLSKQETQTLLTNTEGWPAGVQLAAQDIKNHPEQTATEIIHRYEDHSRILGEFFFDELMSAQPTEVRQFLVKTACLDQLTVDLCNQIMDKNDSREILSFLMVNHLFIEKIDQMDEGYRYHPLFVQVLRKNFALLPQKEQKTIHGIAAKWYEENSSMVDCVKHLVASKNYLYLNELLSKLTPVYLSHAETIKLRNMYDLIPPGVFLEYPWLSIYRAWVYSSTEPDSIGVLIQQARNAIQSARTNGKYCNDEIELMLGDIASLQTITTSMSNQTADITSMAEQALSLQGDRLPKVKGLVLKLLADSYIQQNQFEKALSLLFESKQQLLAGGNFGGVAETSNIIGEIFFTLGQLFKAEREYKEVISTSKFTSKDTSYSYCCYSGLGSVQLEWNDLVNSHDNLLMGYEMSRGRIRSGELSSGILLARYYQRLNQLEKSEKILAELRKPIQSQYGTSTLESRYDACYIHQLAQVGDFARIEHVIKKCHVDIEAAHQTDQESTLVAYAVSMLYCNKPDISLKIIRGIEKYLEEKHHIGALIVTLVIKTSCYQTLGMDQEAESAISKAIELTYENNFIRIFVDFRKYILSPLTGLVMRKKNKDNLQYSVYIGEIVNACLQADQNQNQQLDNKPAVSKWTPLVSSGFLEPLTFQEQKILSLLSIGKSNSEIAQDISISINTVKKHTANIYAKLGVHDRLHASNRARDLGII